MLPIVPILLAAVVLVAPAPADARPRGGGGAAAGQSEPNQSGKADAVVAAARSAVGSPYASGGTTKDGFDCSGLTTWAFKKAGIKLPRTSYDQFEIGSAVPRSEIVAGDLVFFDTNGPGASHVGVAVSETRAISATSSGVMEHSTRGGYWSAHYVGARRR